jgi:hypothetical protein
MKLQIESEALRLSWRFQIINKKNVELAFNLINEIPERKEFNYVGNKVKKKLFPRYFQLIMMQGKILSGFSKQPIISSIKLFLECDFF